jgi:LysM repeat protein
MSDKQARRLDDAGLSGVSGGAAEPRKQKIGYTVKRGDTLIKIAAQFDVSILDLIAWNDIRNPDLIYAGQTLVIYKG